MPHANPGFADAIIGTQHGDEGKGRFVDSLASDYDWIVRYNGGGNAGHTVKVNGRTLALNSVPSGVNHPGKKLFIAAHCVVEPVSLCEEIRRIEQCGLTVRDRLRISPQASVTQPSHILRDTKSMKGAIGTTGKGIGPTYADQAARSENGNQLDIRMGDLVRNTQWALDQIRNNLETEMEKRNISGNDYDVESTMQKLAACIESITPLVESDPLLLSDEVRRGARILLEGAQAFALDRTWGITPNVTSSNTGVAAAFVSTGIPVDFKRNAWGVAKLTPSRVGHGPFVPEFGSERSEEHCMKDGGDYFTRDRERELFGNKLEELFQSDDQLDIGIALRIAGGEYGATTGRPRRMGMLDLVQIRYAVNVNGLDGLYLTKGDRLADYSHTRTKGIPVVTDYELNGETIRYVPTTDTDLRSAVPVYKQFDAFKQDLSNARNIHDLPGELKELLRWMRDRLETPLIAVGVGPSREQVVALAEKL